MSTKQTPEKVQTVDLPTDSRISEVRERLKQMRAQRNSSVDTLAVHSVWLRRSPEYVEWLLESYDDKAIELARAEQELKRVKAELAHVLEKQSRTSYSNVNKAIDRIDHEDATHCVQDIDIIAKSLQSGQTPPRLPPRIRHQTPPLLEGSPLLSKSQGKSETFFVPEELAGESVIEARHHGTDDDEILAKITNLSANIETLKAEVAKSKGAPVDELFKNL